MAFQRKGTALALANVDGRLGNQNNLGAGIKSFKSLVSVLSADVDGDQYPVALVPSNAVLSFAGTLIRNTAITGGTSYKIAVHYNDISQDGDIGDSVGDLSGVISMATAREITGATVLSGVAVADSCKPLWEALGLASDPGGSFLVVLTATTVGSVDGSVVLELGYSA